MGPKAVNAPGVEEQVSTTGPVEVTVGEGGKVDVKLEAWSVGVVSVVV